MEIGSDSYSLLCAIFGRHYKHEQTNTKHITMTNIKSIFLVLLLQTVLGTTYGQTNKFDIGVEGGPSLIFLRGNDLIDNNHKPAIGFSGGLFFQYNFKKVVSLRTNIAFERKGSVFTEQSTDINGNPLGKINTNTNFDYLTFPILVRATFGKRVQYFINAGPYFGYLIKQASVIKGDNVPTITIDNTLLDKRFDIGISAGLGLSLPVKTKFAFSFEVRNNLGLYKVSEVPINNGTIKTNSTNFLLGFTYKLGQRSVDTTITYE